MKLSVMVVVVVLAAAALFWMIPVSQEEQPAPKDEPKAPAPLPDLKPIQKSLEELRGLKFKEDVPSERQSLDDFKKFIEQDLEKDFPKAKRDNVQMGLLRLGMIREKVDLGENFINAYLSQAAAYYNPESNKFFYLTTGMSGMLLEATAAHELVHALQDQHYDLNKVVEGLTRESTADVRNDDFIYAVRCLVEGEANYVGILWLSKKIGNDLTKNRVMEELAMGMVTGMDYDQMISTSKAEGAKYPKDHPLRKASEGLETVPRYIMVPLLSAYLKGANFSMKARHKGGWEKLNDIWKDQPRTAEQCLHPEKYLEKRDLPTTIPLPESAALKTEGWTVIDAAIHGECYLTLLLRENGVAAAEAATATAGWDGDIYRAWRKGEGGALIQFATTWDTADDAKEFHAAYKNVLAAKYKAMKEISEKDGRMTYDCGGESPGRGVLLLRDREVFAVEGGSAELVDTLLEELEGLKIEHKE